MIDINLLFTEQQKNAIVEIISRQCRQYREYRKIEQSLYYEPYMSMRRQYGLTSAMISGFSPRTLNVEGLSVEDLQYGLNDKLCQPMISSRNGIFHIYSDGSDLRGAKIREYAKKYNQKMDEYPIFL